MGPEVEGLGWHIKELDFIWALKLQEIVGRGPTDHV